LQARPGLSEPGKLRRPSTSFSLSSNATFWGMILKIRQVGEQVLRQQARPLSRDEILDRSTQELIESMRETMHDAPGVGLAAPQVGYSLQLVVIEDQAEFIQKLPAAHVTERERRPVPFHILINPKLTLLGSGAAEFFEGCLSLAGF